jgi:Bacterial Ig-like domain (group 3)/FG-GAP-like repeat/FG-GAP repeat
MHLREPANLLLGLLLTASAAARNIAFAPASTFASGAGTPTRVWVADLNGDGIPDLVISDAFSSVAVLIGNGDGTFQAPTVYTEDFYVTGGVAIADFNGDHKLDLAVVGGDTSGNGLALFTGNGDGTFNPPIYSTTLLAGAAIVPVVGDFNNDGDADIFIGGNGSSEVMLGDGNGTFSSQSLIPVSGDGVAIGDFNHDGILDVAATNFINDEVAILIGNGDGTFQTPVIISVASEPSGITCADFNNDGNPDLAVTLYSGEAVAILLGDGAGGFTNSGQWYAGAEPGSVAAADFSLDKDMDLAVSDFGDDGISLLTGNGTGVFLFPLDFSTGDEPTTVAVGDFNQDGSPDLAVTNYRDNNVAILLNEAGTFVPLSSSPNPSKLGQPVTFTATVKGSVLDSTTPTGKLIFKEGSTVLATERLKRGSAFFATSALSEGAHKVTASYSGDSTFNPNNSEILVQTVK